MGLLEELLLRLVRRQHARSAPLLDPCRIRALFPDLPRHVEPNGAPCDVWNPGARRRRGRHHEKLGSPNRLRSCRSNSDVDGFAPCAIVLPCQRDAAIGRSRQLGKRDRAVPASSMSIRCSSDQVRPQSVERAMKMSSRLFRASCQTTSASPSGLRSAAGELAAVASAGRRSMRAGGVHVTPPSPEVAA